MLADLQHLHGLLKRLIDEPPAVEQNRDEHAALIERADQLEAENDQLQEQVGILKRQQQEFGPATLNMRQEIERLGQQLAQLALTNRQLIDERDTLLRKNEDARLKVEEILTRLSALPAVPMPRPLTPDQANAAADSASNPTSPTDQPNRPAPEPPHEH